MNKKDRVGKKKRIKRTTDGGRNLLLLGIASVLIAIVTTGISLIVYHNSGDIYLDRSRPGYLPDEEEVGEESEEESEYDFSKDGSVTVDGVDEYLKELNAEIEAIDSYKKPFESNVLSDKNLGISEESGSGE